MLKVTIQLTRWPAADGNGINQHFIDNHEAYICPTKIETITSLEGRQGQMHVPKSVRSVIRCPDLMNGYRLHFVTEPASVLASERERMMRGEPPPEFDLEVSP